MGYGCWEPYSDIHYQGLFIFTNKSKHECRGCGEWKPRLTFRFESNLTAFVLLSLPCWPSASVCRRSSWLSGKMRKLSWKKREFKPRYQWKVRIEYYSSQEDGSNQLLILTEFAFEQPTIDFPQLVEDITTALRTALSTELRTIARYCYSSHLGVVLLKTGDDRCRYEPDSTLWMWYHATVRAKVVEWESQ